MKAQANVRTTPNVTRRWPIRLLLAGDENEIDSDVMHRTFEGSPARADRAVCQPAQRARAYANRTSGR